MKKILITTASALMATVLSATIALAADTATTSTITIDNKSDIDVTLSVTLLPTMLCPSCAYTYDNESFTPAAGPTSWSLASDSTHILSGSSDNDPFGAGVSLSYQYEQDGSCHKVNSSFDVGYEKGTKNDNKILIEASKDITLNGDSPQGAQNSSTITSGPCPK